MRIVGLLLVSAVLLLHVAPTDSRELGCFNAKRVYKFFRTRVPVGTRKFASRCGVKCRNTAGKFTYFALERDTKKCTCLSRPKMSFFKGLRPYRKRPCGKSGNVKLYRFPKAPGKSKRRPIRRKFPRRKIRRDRCPTRYGYKKRKTGCYAVFQQAFTWPEAAIFCFVEGARLVEINNKKKNKDVAALAKALRKDVWIGANDIIQENALRFIGTNRGVKAFFKKKIGNNKRKNCVKLSANSKWRSSNCNNRRPFICERYPRRWE
ncbi:uncharacterized protein LOC125659585 [Ostrea edulis]|uniref:uncharacterized protein LOC125659585 n=1 Tax=Ostrea edulis TaxID=37623 RepID=UPI0024AEB830|nr:uncharacterized protein LOC125659585 [Ostrea edulis]